MKVAGCIFSLMIATAASAAQLKVRGYNTVTEAGALRLSQLIETEELDADTRRELHGVILGDSPRLGEKRIFSNKAIALAIRESARDKVWSVQIPRQVIVENRGHDLDRKTVEARLLSTWTKSCESCRLQIKSLTMPVIPKEFMSRPYELEISDEFPRGSFSQKISFTRPDGTRVYFWVTGQIEVRKRVPVIVRSVPAGFRLTEADFRYEWRDVTYQIDGIPEAAELIGGQIRTALKASDVIWRNSVARERAVRRGDVVRVLSGDKSWEVTLQAVTEQDGYVGDIVNLRNPQTKKMITGRVVAAGEVQLQ